MDEREHERKNIEQYVLSQDREVEVTHAQRIMQTKVYGEEFEVWDVHTSGSRYWVITNPTNLYDQATRPSYDETLSFHIGLRMRIFERQRTELPDEAEGLVDTSWRRFEQAFQAYNRANEAEDYQAVGIHCREALVALAAHLREVLAGVTLPSPPPKGSDFKAWADLAAEHIATGRLRGYLKVLNEKAWDLAVWLQHYADATPWDAELVLDATSNAISAMGVAIKRHEKGEPERCPKCRSYRVDSDGEIDENDVDIWRSRMICAACEHVWGERSQRWDAEANTWRRGQRSS